MSNRIPVFEGILVCHEGEEIKYLTLQQTFKYFRNQSFVNPSSTPEAVPNYPVGYLLISENDGDEL